MNQWQLKWKETCEKYLQLTPREQYLVLLTGLVAIIFIIFYIFIDNQLINKDRLTQQITQFERNNETLKKSANEYQAALKTDPNIATNEKIAQCEKKLAAVDTKLLTLTSELISPTQMRQALLSLLKLEKGVTLLSFELIGAEPLLSKAELEPSSKNDEDSHDKLIADDESMAGINLYRHGIKITLSGSYFELRDYLLQLEQLSWKFFWQEFDLSVKDYPMNELSIEIYSLGSKEAFVGV
jgi:MSHA biogenesis protein MshJ